MRCSARIRPMADINDVELGCERDAGHIDSHEGKLRDYAYPGSVTTVSWQDSDRRNFTGLYQPCQPEVCFLPLGHRGGHW